MTESKDEERTRKYRELRQRASENQVLADYYTEQGKFQLASEHLNLALELLSRAAKMIADDGE